MSEHSKKKVMGKYMGHMNFSPIFAVFLSCMSFFFKKLELAHIDSAAGETR